MELKTLWHRRDLCYKHLTLLEKGFDIDLMEFKDFLLSCEKISYKRYIRVIKEYLIEKLKFNKINLSHFESAWGGINLIKLDAWLFNKLIGKVKNLNDLSGIEKLEIFIDNEKEFKKIKYLLF